MMMKSSMNSPAFSLLLLTAHLCLWITPAFSITITQDPKPAVVGKNVAIKIPDFDPATAAKFLVCSWFFGTKLDDQQLISMYDKTTLIDKQTNIKIDNKCALTITALTQDHITTYTLQIHYNDRVEIQSFVLSGSERFAMNSIVLLSLAGLISSLTLF